MSEKKWDAWKDHDNYIERAIYRQEAEREQLVRDTKKRFHGNDHLLFRGEFLGLIAPEYTIELKLHSEAKPHVTILDKDRKLMAIITLGGLMEAQGMSGEEKKGK